MTRIAVLSDIHGNLPALEAVLEDLDRHRPDEVLVGGDLVGRGPQGSAVVSTIRERGWRSVRGNHEDYMLDFRNGNVPAEWLEAREFAASRWMAAELSAIDAGYLDRLPMTLRSRLLPGLRLVHGTPRSNREGIGPWTGPRELETHLEEISEQLLVCCHTHRPLERRLPGGVIVNVGSVGLPFDGDPRAQYAIFALRGDRWEVELRRVAYDRGLTLAAYERSGFSSAGGVTAELLKRELQEARALLVPFLSWARRNNVPPVIAEIETFLSAGAEDELAASAEDAGEAPALAAGAHDSGAAP